MRKLFSVTGVRRLKKLIERMGGEVCLFLLVALCCTFRTYLNNINYVVCSRIGCTSVSIIVD